ncbi:CLOCK-interacting pacemaker-like [Corythoichthys intestinalis]|uniref:CLOCK-interacting pacemaker-like n=1 Tax=Corythoichthys intestinalis TaxID=161448 RepID=UPI0025A55F9B|nr:CLOCK-interacting pacemaker-like [Corythoichthys intestinalis]XP_061798373.1 CLOCK-interacting pacemaker-like [Nerophis lumbriciformis]
MSSFSQLVQHGRSSFTSVTHYVASKQDLERDSGFSDASSEYLGAVDGTDCEDAGRRRSTVGQDASGVQLAVMGGSYAGLSPMLIMNNFVLNQPSHVNANEKQWGFPSSLDVMPQSQMVLLQPMISPKTTPENTPQSKSYMSTLKSYPRIAPNSADTLSKRPGSSRIRGNSSSVYDQRHRRYQHRNGQRGTSVPEWTQQEVSANCSTLPAENSEPLNEKCLSSMTVTTSPSPRTYESRTELDNNPDICPDGLLAESDKLKRFSNTYNILSNCGLLGITMRTKQLIKDNKRTQSQIQLLREHTALLLEALGSGDPQLWTKLQLSLQDYNK